jgi:hypothetical protein
MRLAALPIVAIAAACGSAASDPADDGIALPERTVIDDAGRDARVVDGGPGASDAAVDADASPAPKLCGEPDLLLCFSFEGEVKDGSPNAFAPGTQGITFTAGKAGQAVVLTSTSFIRFATAPLLTAPVTTVEAWVRPAQVLAESVIFDADERYAMSALPDGSLQCNTTNVIVKGGLLPLGAWTHVACVYDGTKVRVYVGGALQNVADGSNGLVPVSMAAAVGGNAPTGQPFVGAIDSFRVFKVARTAAQIAAAAAAP